jgi:hypothetical protein
MRQMHVGLCWDRLSSSTNLTTSAWLKPLNIRQARDVKFGAQFTFLMRAGLG